MDYQKEMQQELREELAPQIAAALSERLGETWVHIPPVEGSWYTYITGPGGCGIHISAGRGGRLNVYAGAQRVTGLGLRGG